MKNYFVKGKKFSSKLLYVLFLLIFSCCAFLGYFSYSDRELKERIKNNDFQVGDIVNGWKVVKSIRNQWLEGTLHNSYVLFEGEIKVKVKYDYYEGDMGNGIVFYLSKDDVEKLPVKLYRNEASISDQEFPYEIEPGTYGIMEVVINKIQKIEAASDAVSDLIFVSKILQFNEIGNVVSPYFDFDYKRNEIQNNKANKFLKSDSFEIKKTLPFSIRSDIRSANLNKLQKIIGDYSINAVDGFGDSLLHAAIKLNSNSTIKFVLEQKGININLENNLGRTPIHLAAIHNDSELISILLSKGADINLVDNDGNNILHLTVISKHFEILKFLLEKKVLDPTEKNNFSRTPLYYSSDYITTKLLLENGSKLSELEDEGSRIMEIAISNQDKGFVNLLLENGFNINSKVPNKMPILFYAAKNNLDFIKFLVSKGADINAQSNDGSSLVHDISNPRTEEELLKFLSENKANLNVKNNKGKTALHEAAFFTNLEKIKLLLKYGADPSIKDGNGLTPVEIIMNHNPRNKDEIERKTQAINLLNNFNSNHDTKSKYLQ